MHPDIAARLGLRPFITRPEIYAMGLEDSTIVHGLRSGGLVRIGPGLYAGAAYRRADTATQHRIRCSAVATRFADRVAFTHQSAAVLHGLPTWGVDLENVHVTRVDRGRGRRQADVSHHVGRIHDDELTTVAGLPVSTLARTLWDLAALESTESALVTIDAALYHRLTTPDELLLMAERYATWKGARHAKVAFTLADPDAESPGESRSRYVFHAGGLPRPVSQFKVFDESGVLLGVADWAWPEHRHLAEFDGMLKYRRELDLAREKAREDGIRRQGWGMTRIVWSQLATPDLRTRLTADLRRAMDDSRRQFGPRAS